MVWQYCNRPACDPLYLDELVKTSEANRAHRHTAPVHVDHLHWEIEAGGRGVEADAEVCTAEHGGVVGRLKPHGQDTKTLQTKLCDLGVAVVEWSGVGRGLRKSTNLGGQLGE